METVLETNLAHLPRIASGKVRDIYAVGEDKILLVASDRISAFDVILNQGIPDKGRVLTQISAFWFRQTSHLLPNHQIETDIDVIRDSVPVTDSEAAMLDGRAMLCRRTATIPVEAVVRGYLSGSAWAEYRDCTPDTDGNVNLWGQSLPAGLRESDRLPEPIFTPSTKAAEGHDLPMTWDETVALIGKTRAEKVRDCAIALYEYAATHAKERGILLADTKFEFGTLADGTLLLIDEALTPDSSRFWDGETYEPGKSQPSYDKQFVRDYLLSVPGWDRTPPAPDLPSEVVAGTTRRYRDAYRRLTGHELGTDG